MVLISSSETFGLGAPPLRMHRAAANKMAHSSAQDHRRCGGSRRRACRCTGCGWTLVWQAAPTVLQDAAAKRTPRARRRIRPKVAVRDSGTAATSGVEAPDGPVCLAAISGAGSELMIAGSSDAGVALTLSMGPHDATFRTIAVLDLALRYFRRSGRDAVHECQRGHARHGGRRGEGLQHGSNNERQYHFTLQCLRDETHQRRVMTTSRYSLGMTAVPSFATLNSAIRARMSASSDRCAFGSSAAKAFSSGP
jgi:hypothetical protein